MDLAPLIASAGVLGVAVGLGSQTLIRDFISGLFMLVEDQYGVGDEVQVLDVSGIVESVGLRITTIRDNKGTLWYLRNGEILKLGNKSKK
jgi:small-conductance mechanosensitive channel